MNTFYEVLDRSTGNVVKDYPTEEAAFKELESIVQTYGVEEIKDFALLRFQDGKPTLVAMEEALIARLQCDETMRQADTPAELAVKP